ncbi:regulation of nuclear pre-mRNA domain-containing protein 1B [Bacillus rossius redtenbacheri]|uniref:regulation of nuclear pre-mRNA domain-containing protein 1B n=1 Tax=Bacillus rossius redtenbacheri TaxID=93214 RepID=UPI002FDD7EF3
MMAGFTESAMVKKLAEVNSSQQSIQTLSLWLIHHRKHHATIVKVWFKELLKADYSRKLTLMYLANDVIQNSKKKGPEFGKEFATVLKRAFENIDIPENDKKIKRNIERLLQIWEERGVYDSKLIKECRKALESRVTATGEPVAVSAVSAPAKEPDSAPPKKKAKVAGEHARGADGKRGRLVRPRSDSEVEVEVDGRKELHVTLSPHTPLGDPPEPEELVKALLDLESSASSDAAVRERIAKLPPEVSEVSLLSNLTDKAQGERLAGQVGEAVKLLTDYNARLAAEMEDRKKVTTMLHDFMQAQKDLLLQAEQRIEEYTEKLQKVYAVRQEVKSHLQNLPDLTQLPDVTGGLAPLPSAGDLFNMH